MKGKELLKRLVYGKLEAIPADIGEERRRARRPSCRFGTPRRRRGIRWCTRWGASHEMDAVERSRAGHDHPDGARGLLSRRRSAPAAGLDRVGGVAALRRPDSPGDMGAAAARGRTAQRGDEDAGVRLAAAVRPELVAGRPRGHGGRLPRRDPRDAGVLAGGVRAAAHPAAGGVLALHSAARLRDLRSTRSPRFAWRGACTCTSRTARRSARSACAHRRRRRRRRTAGAIAAARRRLRVCAGRLHRRQHEQDRHRHLRAAGAGRSRPPARPGAHAPDRRGADRDAVRAVPGDPQRRVARAGSGRSRDPHRARASTGCSTARSALPTSRTCS